MRETFTTIIMSLRYKESHTITSLKVFYIVCFQVGKVVEHSDGGVLFLFMFAYTMATISQCFCISVFFSRANLAAASAGIIYFCTYLPYPLCTRFEEYMTFPQKFLAVSTINVWNMWCTEFPLSNSIVYAKK